MTAATYVRPTNTQQWAVIPPTRNGGWYVAAIHDSFDAAADDAAEPSPFDMICDPPLFTVPALVEVGK